MTQDELNYRSTDVVIAAGDNSPFFLRCMLSINKQGEFINEIYVILNNSSELAYFEGELKKLPVELAKRVNLIETVGARNANIARNVGFMLSENKYVAYLDIDDEWEEDHIRQSLNEMKSKDAICCYSGMFVCDGNKITKLSATDYKLEPNIETYLIKKKPAPTSSLVVDKYKAKHAFWNWELNRHQDYDYLSQLSKIGELTHKPEITVNYHVHNQTSNRKFADCFLVLRSWKNELDPELYQTHKFYLLKKLFKNKEYFSCIKWLLLG